MKCIFTAIERYKILVSFRGGNMKNVLVIDSVDDDITRYRHSLHLRDYRLMHYRISYMYAVDINDEEREDLNHFVIPRFEIDEDELYGKLISAITRSNPSIIIVHTGFVFDRYPKIFAQTLKKLKTQNSNIDIGIQWCFEQESFDFSFNNTEEVKTLVKVFFGH